MLTLKGGCTKEFLVTRRQKLVGVDVRCPPPIYRPAQAVSQPAREADKSAVGTINDSVGKFCTDNWTVRKRYQLIVQNKLLSTIQAYPLGFLTGDPMPWKRFCLFCLFHASLSIVYCSVQLVSTKFPNRFINRALPISGVFR